MSEPKFTKGPWKYVKKQDYYNCGVTEHYYDVYEVVDSKNHLIAKAGKIESDNLEANAALIACAPTMYAMLERILDFKTGGPFISTNPSVTELAHLLMKARGEE